METDRASDFRMGYIDYFGALFGNSSLFQEGSLAECQRCPVSAALNDPGTVAAVLRNVPCIVHEYVEDHVNVSSGAPTCSYELFKMLVSRCMIYALLGLRQDQCGSAEIDKIVQLGTAHWHGIASVPVTVRLPFNAGSSGYGRALKAKVALQECICSHALASDACANRPPAPPIDLRHVPNAADELLLLLCALIPKAAASICASLALYAPLWNECFSTGNGKDCVDVNVLSDEQLDALLSELCRVRPPFFGGRRVATKDTSVGGVRVNAGRPVVYINAAAHRDPGVFDRPAQFDPHRWTRAGSSTELFTFGGGQRVCVGRSFVLKLIKALLHSLCTKYSLRLVEPSEKPVDVPYKHLPVSRPKQPVNIALTPRINQE